VLSGIATAIWRRAHEPFSRERCSAADELPKLSDGQVE
jgi:hypothetical protein